tara:strand:+ start:488 stop:673 length:186 start_codon:yes stop_codon:yes gene_type:complete
MDINDVKRLVKLRQYVIKKYNALDDIRSAPSAIMRQSETAEILETIVRSIDDLIKEEVNFS